MDQEGFSSLCWSALLLPSTSVIRHAGSIKDMLDRKVMTHDPHTNFSDGKMSVVSVSATNYILNL